MKQKLTYFSIVLMLCLIGVVVGALQAGDEESHRGLVENRPDGLVGTWVIGGLTFEADSNTQFNEEDGPLEVGTCADVDYVVTDTANLALEIDSKALVECNDDNDNIYMEVYGYLDAFPDGLVGDWVVNGITYTADANTEFEIEYGDFAVGICVEVEYIPDTLQALEIETKPNYKCDGNDVALSQVNGVLQSFPDGLIGDWVVNGVTYVADANTEFDQEDGPFFIDGCVEVKYMSATNAAVEISTTEADDCSNGSGFGHIKFYGLIGAIPDGLVGVWTIGGLDFTSTITTELDTEDGDFAVGVCASVEYYDDAGTRMATEIDTEGTYHCNGDSYTNEIYGLIDSFPAALFGTWVVDGILYAAEAGVTEFDTEEGDFAVGGCVKVTYYVMDGINQAVEIETEEGDDCQGNDLPGLSKVYATIDSLPPDPFIGAWQIGGVAYEADANTDFEQEHGDFAVGICVEAEYDANGGTNLLYEVDSEPAYKCQDGAEFTAYGVIESYPSNLLGSWQVSGITYEADANTEFEEEFGFFAVGAYVEVDYVVSNDLLVATKIETHVAPNAGHTTVVGILNSHDNNDDWNDWVVDGVTYQADPVIEVGSGLQAPQVGQVVRLNSYANNGVQYATAVTAAQQAFLPIFKHN